MIRVSEELAVTIDSPLLEKLTNSYAVDLKVRSCEIDGFGHMNNANYIQWLDHVHWSHLREMGISVDDIVENQWGFVVYRTNVTYLAPLLKDDIVIVGTSIIQFDSKFRMTRQFQLVRRSDSKTVLTGTIEYISVDISTGKPTKVPHNFSEKIDRHSPNS